MYDGAITRLGADHPGLNDVVPPQTDDERAAALAKRASRRAYDGAPPTIPHRIQQMAPPDCVACHRDGAKVGEKIAPKFSHAFYQSCVQCHVVASDPRPVASTPPPPENQFVGLASWGRGTRWGAGAPPMIPHPTRMRSDCTSCHGVFGTVGLRTPHPWRQSCTQCHVANAANDQLPSSGSPAVVAASLGPGGATP
jgi:cytochrome c-type protein NapB